MRVGEEVHLPRRRERRTESRLGRYGPVNPKGFTRPHPGTQQRRFAMAAVQLGYRVLLGVTSANRR